MTWLLDTNTCIRYLNGRSPAVVERLRRVSPGDVAVCSVVKAELFAGAMRTVDPARTLARQRQFLARLASYPFDDTAAEVYGHIRAELATKGMLIGPNDLLIAAIAVARGLVLVTHNVREFSRVDGLRFEDWEATA